MKIYHNNYYRANNNGFTLIEMLATVIILGIIGAIAAPNLMALFSHHRVNNALSIINGAVKEAQRQAIRQGISCTVTINPGDNDPGERTIAAVPASCLPEVRLIDDDVDIANDDITVRVNLVPTANEITFSAKGNTTSGGTIAVFSDSSDTQRCFVIANGLGITRTGNYTGPNADPVNAPQCDSN
ncbi:prepilin-type N-terminal cleavage/methylation domain-containing protein [Xenococcus sp. PCC 7305]|uniref:GspH/FimT family pseudopilin n=1 Tax=Xenococcus sp. PCC 7305 TaxID=102125 RepID=UPI0002AD1364|nr:GspH/FimT family pseudopilin [Xenococcus sp. PCC 7305]ELS02343.1 prepilin-type N-terminal cleavage/methylation domain-containing protein [Xenococcus sp. PCC 7305]